MSQDKEVSITLKQVLTLKKTAEEEIGHIVAAFTERTGLSVIKIEEGIDTRSMRLTINLR